MLGSLILYLKAIRIVMFQLSGFYYKGLRQVYPAAFSVLRGDFSPVDKDVGRHNPKEL